MVKYIPLTRGKVALVDDGDYDLASQFKWQAKQSKKRWYAVMSYWDFSSKKLRGRTMHGLIMGIVGREQVDHINLDGLDNRRENLRTCENGPNQHNRPLQKNNTTGFKGVSPHLGAYLATICVQSKKVHVGRFSNPVDAARAYDAAAIKYFGDFARVNFPENKNERAA